MSNKINAIDKMCDSYRILYELETKLRTMIDDTLTREFGYTWHLSQKYISFDFHTAHYYQLLQIIRKFPTLKEKFTQKQIEKLTNLNAIRNKICHMRDISIPEYKKLVTCHKIVISKIEKRKVS
ncbi:hypothetical protein J2Z37_001889 [Ammoniphilus resinae]|uniref:Swt1-like HEPN domain-containing protein n=1 Tax=Ammoniphilus resinae TaxID=861532 RepID=A0ABS4GNP6_9BACL|nr:hypothetical protein [Ammoniphilus resinae]